MSLVGIEHAKQAYMIRMDSAQSCGLGFLARCLSGNTTHKHKQNK